MQDRADDAADYRFAFVIEQNLGHRTHYRNLVRYVGEDPTITPTWLPIEFEATEPLYRLPVLRSNVSVRSSVQAWQALRRERRAGRWDAIFYHTQTPSLLSPLPPGPRASSPSTRRRSTSTRSGSPTGTRRAGRSRRSRLASTGASSPAPERSSPGRAGPRNRSSAITACRARRSRSSRPASTSACGRAATDATRSPPRRAGCPGFSSWAETSSGRGARSCSGASARGSTNGASCTS